MPTGALTRNQLVASAAYMRPCPTTMGGADLRAAPDWLACSVVGGVQTQLGQSIEDTASTCGVKARAVARTQVCTEGGGGGDNLGRSSGQRARRCVHTGPGHTGPAGRTRGGAVLYIREQIVPISVLLDESVGHSWKAKYFSDYISITFAKP